jgi:bifunctional non-homologous end joining protein LigD
MPPKPVGITHRDLTAPTSKAKPFNHPDWVWELKHDGYRADIALDGELVMLDENGKPEFHQLRGRCAMSDPQRIGMAAVSKPAAVFAFDVLQLRGKDLRALPLLKRKATLEKELTRTERIVYCKHIGETGEKLFQAADRLGLEGVIGKKADSPYRAGRTPNWVKVKTAHGRHIDEERAKWKEQ